ncbi:uncharacterized protein LOC111701042 [Eurytemora carolleeae]|uniref:uncharacterized protein LOC111701042 n=1 Tax=Eurytemora carolleeae TaxID=1294199 RepID=UPI000C760669|nr:uncharacterized protein LOC111701042 [Eurytemora carolleeae]|eukprot:XP_023327926.1 uncharacterized protein LOC111701042 [Eurytemora affinis]
MSSRYIARKYGESRTSRSQSVAGDNWSRASSQIREVGSGYSTRATTPEIERPWSSASTYNYYTNYPTPSYNNQTSGSRPSTPQPQRNGNSGLVQLGVPRRGLTPPRTVYSDALLKSSRKLRERSFSPTREHVATVRSVSQYKANSDYYRGKTKSIYEREPMFDEFVSNLPLTDLHAFNSTDLGRLKRQFQAMVENRWSRKQCNDPSVPHDTAYKASSWSNYLAKPSPASVTLGEKHRYRGKTPSNLPRIYVYHRSTQ